MGLDMYLEGERYHSKYNENGEVKGLIVAIIL